MKYPNNYLVQFEYITTIEYNDHAAPVFDGVGLAGFKSTANGFLLA